MGVSVSEDSEREVAKMLAEELFLNARQAAKRLVEVYRLLTTEGEDWHEPGNGQGDPTSGAALAHVQAAEHYLQERDTLLEIINEARILAAGVGQGLGTDYRDVLTAYYIDAMSLESCCTYLGISKPTLLRRRSVALEWIDTVGIARAKAGKGIAEM